MQVNEDDAEKSTEEAITAIPDDLTTYDIDAFGLTASENAEEYDIRRNRILYLKRISLIGYNGVKPG